MTDVVIVGGGVMGAATFFELAQRGVDVRLIERDRFAGESSGKSAAIVRMHYSNPSVVRMALRSREIFASFPDITGSSAGYRAGGWTFLVPEEDEAAVRETFAMNRREGVDVEEVPLDALDAILPGVDPVGVALALHEPRSGYADPRMTVEGYVSAGRRLGGTAEEGVPVVEIMVGSGEVRGVVTPTATIGCETVVLAAGAWSAKLARSAGIDLSYRVTREEELYVELPDAGAGPGGGSVSSVVDRVYLRPMPEAAGHRGDVYLVGRGFPKEYVEVDPDTVDYAADDAFAADVIERLSNRFSAFKLGRVVGGTVGLYEVTPDWHPYLGAVDGLNGLVLATGGSGHGFKLGPAIGEMVAEAITSAGRVTPCSPIEAFDLQRFARGEQFAAAIGGNRA